MLRAPPYPGPIHRKDPWGPSISRAHSCPGRIGAHLCPGHNHAEGPSLPRACPSRGSMRATHVQGEPRAHPSRGPIGAHPYRGPIHSQSSFIPRAYGMGAHPCSGPSISSVHSGLSMPRAHPCEDPSLPRAHLFRELKGPSMPRACSYRGHISARGPSISRAHGSPFMRRTYPW